MGSKIRTVSRAWAVYRHAAALKTLLESMGIWKWIGFAGACTMSAAVASLSLFPLWGKILLGLTTLAILLFTAGFGFSLYRIWKQERQPRIDLEYDSEAVCFKLFNRSSAEAFKVGIPDIDKPPFCVKWEAEPDTIPGLSYRKVSVFAYDLKRSKIISTDPKTIIKTVWKDQLPTDRATMMVPGRSYTLDIDLTFNYSNLTGDNFETNCVIKFNCLTEQLTVGSANS
jgi:hypothetical protein